MRKQLKITIEGSTYVLVSALGCAASAEAKSRGRGAFRPEEVADIVRDAVASMPDFADPECTPDYGRYKMDHGGF